MNLPVFFVGLHQPSDAKRFDFACVSIRRLMTRKKPLGCPYVLVDSGAFTELYLYGKYRYSVKEYADQLRRIHHAGIANISAAVAQDYMCEPFMLEKTGKTVEEHQRMTIERYDALVEERLPFPIMPVLQGYTPAEYVNHLLAYGSRLVQGMWVGVGSVCKRNGTPSAIVEVLSAIKRLRPDLHLHGFGVKKTSLKDKRVRNLLSSADSMAWSYAARRNGRSANDWREAKAFEQEIRAL